MSGRYGGWRRLSGDTAERPDLLDFGKKLLAYLDQQRRLSGVKTCHIERTLPDGSVVRARFDYDIPSIEVIDSGRAQAGLLPSVLEGFIVAPGGDQPLAFNEVVLQNKPHADAWRAHFFDAVHTPVDFGIAHGIYSKIGPFPLLDAPDGLQHRGRTDWRNAEETLHVTWDGPRNRYSGDQALRTSKIYYKGAVLFDLTDVEDAVLERTGGEITGAALRKDGGALTLLVAAFYGFDSGPDLRDVFLALPLRRPDNATPPVDRIERAPRLEPGYADPAHPEDSITVLLARALTSGLEDAGHPWHFNQSATQARCVRPRPDAQIHECIVDIDLDAGSASYRVVSHAWPGVTTVFDATTDFSPLRADGVVGAGTTDGVTPTLENGKTLYATRQTFILDAFDEEWRQDFGVSADWTTTITPSGAALIAVDFRDDVPVYAYLEDEATTDTLSYRSARAQSWVGTMDGFNHALQAGIDRYTDVAYSLDSEVTSTGTYRQSRTGTLQRLITDWMTAGLAETYTRTEDGALAQTWVGDGSYTFPFGTGPLYPSDYLETPLNYPGTLALTCDRTTVEDRRLVGFDGLVFLDLRYRWLVYEHRDYQLTSTEVVDLDLENTAYRFTGGDIVSMPPPGDGYVFDAWRSDQNETLQADAVTTTTLNRETRALKVTLGGIELASTVLIDDPGTPVELVTDYVTTYSPLLWPLSFFTFQTRWTTRTPDAFYALAPFVTETVPDGSTTLDEANATPPDPDAVTEGGWQTYRDRFCHSATTDTTPPVYTHGLGRVANGALSQFTLPQLTGWTGDPLFHPVTILPPTG